MARVNRDVPFVPWNKRLQYALLVGTLSLLAVSLIAPIYPHEQALQHAPTVFAIAAMTVAARKQIFSLPTFTCIVMFLWLHILGARYIYSFVPYDFWAERFLGTSISNLLGWNRNHYDRIVYLLFGCLATPPAAELAQKYGRLSRVWAITFAVLLVLSAGSLYEIFEWLLTVIMAPGDAEAYNGQQGDLWDAQKDMALAFAGAIFTATCIIVCRQRLTLG